MTNPDTSRKAIEQLIRDRPLSEGEARLLWALRAEADQCGNQQCRWTEDEDGVWDTDCGEKYQFFAEGPTENGMQFCCYCGSRLAEVSYG